MTEPVEIAAIVFDLGGVIVDLAGLHDFLDRHGLAAGDFFAKALSSGAHFDFEAGRIDAATYATAFLREAGLHNEMTADAFLAQFIDWPGRLLPGARELLLDVGSRGVVRASLSNTNPIHWTSPYYAQTVLPLFDRHFPSYELGLAKPEREIFVAVTSGLGVSPDAVVFFDDNQVNVDAASHTGWQGHRVDSPDEARAVLVDLGVLVPSA